MLANSVSYKFSQRFRVPAKQAYKWCTNYEPSDLSLMNEEGQRRIRKVTDDTVILTETFNQNGKMVKKIKLVKLNPTCLSWYNIQILGPNKNSAFIYQIVPEGKSRSKLTYIGLLVVYSKAPFTPKRIKQIATNERRGDSNAWKLLARAMEKDINY
ncbi:MAG: hypothetical protein ABSD41_00435 [Candidatus Bathyarchaeia archaeon]|jgi:hypothetical protein